MKDIYLNGKRWTGSQYGDVKNNRKCEIKNGKGFIREFQHSECFSQIDIQSEYENGEKNGKAEERYHIEWTYEPPDIKFKGEYLNGKKWNGTETVYQDNSGHYELKNGKGYIMDINSECFYEGE